MRDRISAVTVGELVPATDGTKTLPARAACAGYGGPGFWYCVTHLKEFQKNWDKDTHIKRGKHRFAWICQKHGIEVP